MSDNQCSICGHDIGDNNTRGIGAECAAALDRAIIKAVFADPEKSLEYNWLIEVWIVKEWFLKTFEPVKFRSTFKKAFFESMKTADRISKKQLATMYDMLQWKVDAVECESTFNLIRDTKRAALNKWRDTDLKISRVAIEIARREIRAKKATT